MSDRQRRPKGTGSLRHLGGERWLLSVNVRGQRLSRVFTARNATEANRVSGTVLAELQADRERTADEKGAERELRRRWTVKRYVAYYLEKSGHRLAPTTRERYRQILENQVVPRIGSLLMREVTTADLSRMYAKLGEKGSRRYGGALSGQTIWTVHAVVRALFTFAVDEGDVETSPAASKKAQPNVSRDGRKRDALDVAGVERFVELARTEAQDVFVAVLLSARLGLRRGEALALQWRDVDFEQCEVLVRRAVTETPDDGVTVKATKTGKQRVVPLDDLTVAELRTVQREQRKRRLEYGRGWQGAAKPTEDWIASTVTGAGIAPDDYTNAFRVLAKRHKVAVTPHGLRHAWCSQMIALGFDAVTIATMTGHSPDVLMRTYAHAFDKRKREAVDAMGEARRAARGE